MSIIRKTILSAATVAVAMTTTPVAFADSAGAVVAASPAAEMAAVCQAFGGRFDHSWAYDDKGVQWGLSLSCADDERVVTCRDGLCTTGSAPSTGNHLEVVDATSGAK